MYVNQGDAKNMNVLGNELLWNYFIAFKCDAV